jgi:hypothetical protein
MSELSIDELQAETGELLPERETLGVITIINVGIANSTQDHTYLSSSRAVSIEQTNVTVGSFNHQFFHHHFGGGS